MSQRSAITVRMESSAAFSSPYKSTPDNEGDKLLVSNWFSWNYGERMVSRVAAAIEYLRNDIGQLPAAYRSGGL